MVDSRQAVERAQQMCDAPADAFSAGEWCESANVLAAALADTERERDEWIRRHDHIAQQSSGTVPVVEKLAAEARVAELEAALRSIDRESQAPHDCLGKVGWIARAVLGAHPSGCAKPGGERSVT